MTAQELVLLRHGPVAVEPGVCYGRTDVAPRGDVQALARWARAAVDAHAGIVSSPARRCIALAQALGPHRIDARWAELNFGAWEMQRYDAIGQDAFTLWAADTLGFRPPGGESVSDMQARVRAALDASLPGAASLLVVTHGGPMRAALGQLLNWPVARWTTQQLHFGSLIRLRRDGAAWTLVEHRTAPVDAP